MTPELTRVFFVPGVNGPPNSTPLPPISVPVLFTDEPSASKKDSVPAGALDYAVVDRLIGDAAAELDAHPAEHMASICYRDDVRPAVHIEPKSAPRRDSPSDGDAVAASRGNVDSEITSGDRATRQYVEGVVCAHYLDGVGGCDLPGNAERVVAVENLDAQEGRGDGRIGSDVDIVAARREEDTSRSVTIREHLAIEEDGAGARARLKLQFGIGFFSSLFVSERNNTVGCRALMRFMRRSPLAASLDEPRRARNDLRSDTCTNLGVHETWEAS